MPESGDGTWDGGAPEADVVVDGIVVVVVVVADGIGVCMLVGICGFAGGGVVCGAGEVGRSVGPVRIFLNDGWPGDESREAGARRGTAGVEDVVGAGDK